ncbi:MAG: type II toxin-antitoxin system VapC family toxin [Bacteroidota bacterium]
MAKGYLMDTNVVIDYLSNKLPEENAKIIDNISLQISVITRMELLGWPNGSEDQINILKQFIESSKVINLEEEIIVKTIELFKFNKIKLPDAIQLLQLLH